MKDVSIIGVDLAKQLSHLHGATAEAEVVLRNRLSRKQFFASLQMQPSVPSTLCDMPRHAVLRSRVASQTACRSSRQASHQSGWATWGMGSESLSGGPTGGSKS